MLDVMEKLKEIGKKFQAGDLHGGLALLRELWEQIPAPQVATQNAYLVLEYGVAFALKLQDYDEARLWANRALDFKAKRQDSGEVEFLVGKVAYESGQLDVAKAQFQMAKSKSKGRIFQGEDSKYVALLK